MLALIDMDGTLCNYNSAMLKQLNNLLHGFVEYEIDSWDDEKYDKLVDLIKKQSGFWRTLPKIELGFKAVELLKDYGFDLHILTKGPYKTTSAWSEKVEWVREHLPSTPITITEDKGLVYGDVLVDDWIPYCEAWLKFRPRGLLLMPAHKYNEGFDLKYPDNVLRFNDTNLGEVARAISKWSRRKPGEKISLK